MLFDSKVAVCSRTGPGGAHGRRPGARPAEKLRAGERVRTVRGAAHHQHLAVGRQSRRQHRGCVELAGRRHGPGRRPAAWSDRWIENHCVVASVLDPFLPPATSRLPFGRTVAVCPSRGLGIEARRAERRLRRVEEIYRRDGLAVPLLPPTRRTLLLSCPLLVTEPCRGVKLLSWRGHRAGRRRPGPCARGRIVERGAPQVAVPLSPPATNTRPSASTVAVWACRAAFRLPAAIQVPAVGLKSCAVFRLDDPLMPPATRTLPLVVVFDGGVELRRHCAACGCRSCSSSPPRCRWSDCRAPPSPIRSFQCAAPSSRHEHSARR